MFAVHEIRDRHLEEWMMIGWSYWSRPKVFVWCSVPLESREAPLSEQADDSGQHDLEEQEQEER